VDRKKVGLHVKGEAGVVEEVFPSGPTTPCCGGLGGIEKVLEEADLGD
jgi:hypothetical protein